MSYFDLLKRAAEVRGPRFGDITHTYNDTHIFIISMEDNSTASPEADAQGKLNVRMVLMQAGAKYSSIGLSGRMMEPCDLSQTSLASSRFCYFSCPSC